MAWFETGWGGTGANAHFGGGLVFGANVRIVGDVSRLNNTIRFRGAKGQVQVTGPGGYYFDGMNLRQWVEIPRGTLRINDHHYGTGRKWTGDVYETWAGDWDVGTSAGATSMELNSGAAYGGDGVSWAGGLWVSFPAAGSPSGLTRGASEVTATTAKLEASVSNWGAHCTAGSGQRIEYRAGTSGGFTNLAFTTSSSHSRSVSSLTSNQQYQVRSHVNNGAGRTATSSVLSFYTLPLAPSLGEPTIEATSATIPTTQNNGGGAYTITRSYRIKKGSDDYGSWTTYSGDDLVADGLLPSTEYTIQVRSTTTAGSTEGDTLTFTTLPAAKLVLPDGTVKNAIPHVITADGEEMVQVKVIQP